MLKRICVSLLMTCWAPASSAQAPFLATKSAAPTVIVAGDSITYAGKRARLNSSLNEWRSLLGSSPRHHAELPNIYVWDDLGIQLVTASAKPYGVKQIKVYLNLKPRDPAEDLFTTNPDGTPATKLPTPHPHKPFTGYLELDGFGIDAQSQFWEIRARADRARNLDCGLRDCSHPHGAFGPRGGVYLRLDRNDEFGRVYEFSVAVR
jgi:hypothetical protein